ncbi:MULTISPECIES: glycosyltransferase family 2 protein [Fibrobacter]|uniref:glycosyltransferase family 2 protein n=1 Tax=Fibrobacter TaxID=832 RepID=UPI000BB12226|nr:MULTISPECIES: glycosyltransferase family 2 protein [Fibrobacter]MDD7298341.1 glycosyltransferase family 2 protein [Fibrobacter intestinalis]PBC66920.1 glycosyltransferase involved in cell wall bisynthesis [Fibrobacter sp. UWS1]
MEYRRDLYIFIPAYNVEKELAELLKSIPAQVLSRTAEVCIIDDGSSDATLQIAQKFSREEFRTSVHIKSFAENRGYGAVVQCGLSRAKELAELLHVKYAICLHGDGQYASSAIPEMLRVLENSDAVICQGSRMLGNARQGKMPFYKFWGGKFLTFIENLVFANKLTDRHSGLIAYKISFLKTVNLEKLSSSFDIDFELLALADSRHFRIAEVPIPTRYAGEKSHLRVIPYGLRVLKHVFRKWKGEYG